MSAPKGIDWDAQPLGRVSDRCLARELGCSAHLVQTKRRSAGIAPAMVGSSHGRPSGDWSPLHFSGVEYRCACGVVFRRTSSRRIYCSDRCRNTASRARVAERIVPTSIAIVATERRLRKIDREETQRLEQVRKSQKAKRTEYLMLKRRSLKGRLIDYMAQHPGASERDLTKAMGVARSTAYKMLRALAVAGEVEYVETREPVGCGRYRRCGRYPTRLWSLVQV